MFDRIQLRRGTAAEAAAANPVLLAGEVGVETDSGKFKIGDGVRAWVDLPYSNQVGGVVGDASQLIGVAPVEVIPAAVKTASGARPVGQGELVVNVADLGAAGDGSDGTAAIQQALAAVHTFARTATVFIPPGTYKLTAELNVYSGTTIWMHGATLRREHDGYLFLVGDRGASYTGYAGNTDIHVHGGVLDSNGQSHPATASTWCMSHVENVTFEHVVFRNGANSHFIECNAARHVRVIGCGFEGHNDVNATNYVEAIQLDLASDGGFSAYGAKDGTACDDIEVAGCWFGPSADLPGNPRGVGSHGGRVDGQHRRIRIHHNWFVGLRSYAIAPMNWTDVDISHNQVDGAGGIWVRALPVGDGTTTNTMTIGNVQTGASVAVSGGRIVHNNIKASTFLGIYVNGEDTGKIVDHAVDHNRIFCDPSSALSLTNATNCATRFNTARKGTYGVGYRNDAKCTGTIRYGNDFRGFGASGFVDNGTGSVTTLTDQT